MVKSSKIYLRNVRFHAYHGVLEQENTVGNDYLINLSLEYDFTRAMQTDELSGTINYAEPGSITSVKRLLAANAVTTSMHIKANSNAIFLYIIQMILQNYYFIIRKPKSIVKFYHLLIQLPLQRRHYRLPSAD